jgi:hypothetical protein
MIIPIIGDPTRPRAECLVSRWGVEKQTGRKPPQAAIPCLTLDTLGFMESMCQARISAARAAIPITMNGGTAVECAAVCAGKEPGV